MARLRLIVPRPVVRLLLVLLLAASGTGCAISQKQEIAMGEQLAPQFIEQSGGLVQDPALQRYVNRVGMDLVRYGDRPDLPWEFYVLDSEQLNAFALPGGKIFITRGMLQQLDNEAQLAAILGHEIGHVDERHTVRQMQRTQLVQGGALLAGIFGGSADIANIAQTAGGLALMSYSRGQEKQADLVGLRYITQAGYEPRAMLNVMETLQEAGGAAPIEFLSSHPSPDNRLEYIDDAIETDYANVIAGGQLDAAEFRRFVGGGAGASHDDTAAPAGATGFP